MKAASSRATAAAMVFGCLPRASSLRYRPQRRTCARQAMSRIGGREMLLTRLDLLGDLGTVAIGLGGFNQDSTGMAITRLGDSAEPAPVAAGILTRREPEIAHELARIVEAGAIAELLRWW